ncbi:hypothetical protein IWX49DRAFT_563063 [Phyllosticta citricarpa]
MPPRCRPSSAFLGFFFCVGAESRATRPPISLMLMRPASDSGSPVASSVRRDTKRRSACKTRLDMAAYLNCARFGCFWSAMVGYWKQWVVANAMGRRGDRRRCGICEGFRRRLGKLAD